MASDLGLEATIRSDQRILRSGDVLAGRYRILALLGAGGMGAVHRALDTELDEEVALKVLRAELAADPDALARFRREVRLARRVTHPNIARTYDLGLHAGTHFLTMELIEGESLAHTLRGKAHLSLPEALRVGAEIARGLAAAHVVGVVHRDLKPENVMLTGARVCITDFGIARSTHSVDRASQHTQGPIGTPAYMAPEQLEARDLDGRADVYALGALLFEALTGRLPFEAGTAFSAAAMRLTRDPPDPRTLDAALPEPVARLVLSLLARRREERPDAQSALERLEALRGERAGRAVALQSPRAEPATSGAAWRPDRWIVATTVEAHDEGARAIAGQLDQALEEAFDGLPSFARVAHPGGRATGDPDEVALARRLGADLILCVSVRMSAERCRARLRLVERTDGRTLWHKRIDGDARDPFAFEDQFVAEVRGHFAERFSTPGLLDRGPRDPAVRDVVARARALLLEYRPEAAERAIALLEEAHAAAPADPWITGQLGAALIRRLSGPHASATPTEDAARAEELCLRALSADASIGETYQTLGILRFMQGRMRNCVRAFREAVERDPFLAESHQYLARILAESGREEEAVERAHLALRLEPRMTSARFVLARVALLDGRDGVEDQLREADQRAPGAWVSVVLRMQAAAYRRDAESARRVTALLEGRAGQPGVATMIRWMRHVSGDEALDPSDPLISAFVRPSGPDRARAQDWQLHTELLASIGAPLQRILDSLESAARWSVDLAWVDKSSLLGGLRQDARFAAARAVVAARVAEMWS